MQTRKCKRQGVISGISSNIIIIGICVGIMFLLVSRNESLKSENLQLRAQIKALEASANDIRNQEVILYKDRKIEVIKKVPYKDESCEVELESYKRLINAF